MAVAWTAHRFAGGMLALDAANTVVLRGDTARTFDRFDDPDEIARFADAASHHRSEEFGGRRIVVADARAAAPVILGMREAVDAYFRRGALSQKVSTRELSDLLSSCAAGLEKHDMTLDLDEIAHDSTQTVSLESAIALSVLSLLPWQRSGRIRVCSNCNWLFLDLSRNRSRIWCDMTVCGNRQKARRHYRRSKGAEASHG